MRDETYRPMGRRHYRECEQELADSLTYEETQRAVELWREKQNDLVKCHALGGKFRLQYCMDRQEELRRRFKDGSLRAEFCACHGCEYFTEEKPQEPAQGFMGMTTEGKKVMVARGAELRQLANARRRAQKLNSAAFAWRKHSHTSEKWRNTNAPQNA